MFVIGHKGTTQYEWQYAVIKLFRLSHTLVMPITYYYFDNTQ